MLSNKSPATENSDVTTTIKIHQNALENMLQSNMANSNVTINGKAIPPIKPSMVFPGLISGANLLARQVENLTEEEWNLPVKGDGRSIGVVVHHVASCYAVEIQLTKILASGQPITDVTKEKIDEMNADHAQDFKKARKQETLRLLKENAFIAAEAVRSLSDEELDSSVTVSLSANAPLTTQFFIEDHALRHSWHHLERIKETLK